ncbi:MAG: hypothetical protein JW699_02265 [Chitinispirillaceae bacterium]|nr:hypothetical protein [Chitinispirillaceae bacterium]
MRQSFIIILAAVAFIRCGSGVTYSTASGNVNILNGPTSAAGLAKSAVRKTTTALENGHYALAPSKMTLTVTGIGFIPVGMTQYDGFEMIDVSGCTATFDRDSGSLSLLRTSGFSMPVGTFCGVSIRIRQPFTMVINDTVAGIYSDPASSSGLTTTPPAGGGQPIQIQDQNYSASDGDAGPGRCVTYFDNPISIDENSTPQVYVVFDPTHWIQAQYNNGQFSAPCMGGDVPIALSISRFGKAAYYSNIGTSLAYRMDNRSADSAMSLLFLYADSLTPISVTWTVHDICATSDNSCRVAYNGNGWRAGLWGMLGLDTSHTLAWASPAPGGDNGTITAYIGVFRMPELSTVGQTTVLSYLCTSNIPQPVSGKNYSSGAPDFTPSGILTLTLLEN